MNTIDSLLENGLDEKEAKVYLASLELGEATVLPISKKAGLGRTYCYDILNSLGKKGMMGYTEKRGRRRYSAASPKTLRSIFAKRISDFEKNIPDLEVLFKAMPEKPKVRYFEGKEGAKVLHQEILKEAKEVWFFGSIADWAKNFPDYLDYVQAQIEKKIKVRDLVIKDQAALKYHGMFKRSLQEMRFLPKNMKFATDNMIWGDKLVMISYGKTLHAVSIESPEISQTHRVIFENLWQSAVGKSKK